MDGNEIDAAGKGRSGPLAALRSHAAQMEALGMIAKVMATCSRQSETLRSALVILEGGLGLINGIVMLLDPNGEELLIEALHPQEGLANPGRKVSYKRGEGVIGRVLESGASCVVPRIADEPLFQGRILRRPSSERESFGFICVPILIRGATVGTISVDVPEPDKTILSDALRIMEIVAGVIANDIHNRRLSKIENESLQTENRRLRDALIDNFKLENIVGSSNEMREVFMRVRQVAGADTTVLIRGESGTGKELVASAIHYNSARAGKPFIKVNCAALNENLLESELFGHERGAFTGAVAKRAGRIEEASGGSIFLDEFGEISFNMQVKLLRVIQEREFERVGGNKPIRADVRIIAATNRDLEEAVKNGSFRQDLYYRVNVFPIDLPPLRARKTDILELANHFVAKHSKRLGKSIKRISTPAINMLLTYYWPGNVRELENAIERAMLVSSDDVIHGHDLPPTLQLPETSESGPVGFLKDRVRVLERELVTDALKRNGGNINAAAKELGISGRMVRYKLDDLSIDYERLFGPKRASGRHPKT